MEAESFESGYYLTELSVGELARDRGSNDGVNSAVAILVIRLAALEKLDSVYDIGLVRDSTEGALVNASAALDAFAIVDSRRLVLVHRDCLYLAGVLAGTLTADDSGEGTDLCASAALTALGLVDVSHVVVVEGDRSELTNVVTTVSKTASAGVRNLKAAYGTFVAGYLDYLDNVGV